MTHKNRQRKLAKIVADLSKEPEPYLEPHHHRQQLQQQQVDEWTVSEVAAAAAKGTGFGEDIVGDKVIPVPGSPYAELGGVEPINLMSFAYQIASGMVNTVGPA